MRQKSWNSQNAASISQWIGETLDLELPSSFRVKVFRYRQCPPLPQKYVLITQHHVGEATESIRMLAPKTWRYLLQHADSLIAEKAASIVNDRDFQSSVLATIVLRPESRRIRAV